MPLIAQGLVVLPSNSSTSVLESSATYTGTAEQMAGNSWLDRLWLWGRESDSVLVAVLTDQDGTLYMEQSPDGVNWDSSLSYDVYANVNEVHRLTVTRQYYRTRFTNTSSSTQTFFRLQTMTGDSVGLEAPHNLVVSQDADTRLTRSFDTEIDIAQGKFANQFLVSKYGFNPDVDAAEDIWFSGGDYTGFPVSTLEAVEVLSASANDTSAGTGCRTVYLEGLDGSYNFQSETVTMNGTTPVDTANTYRRVNRAYCVTAGSGTTNAGNITMRHTTTVANVFGVLEAGTGRTQLGLYTVPDNHKCYLKRVSVDMFDTTTNNGLVRIWMRPNGGAVQLTRTFGMSTAAATNVPYYGAIEFTERTDIKFRVIEIDNANGRVSVSFALVCIRQ